MKKISLFLLALVCSVGMMSADDIVWKWTSADASLSCSDGSSHNFTSVDGNYTLTFKAGGSKDKVDATSKTINDVTYTHQLYMNGATNSSKRVLSFTGISGNGYLTLVTGTAAGGNPVLSSAANTTASNVIATITNATGGAVTTLGEFTSDLIEDLDAAKTYYVCFPTKCYLYAVIWSPYTGAPKASMTVTPTEINNVPASGDDYTVEYEIKNPVVGASVSADADVSWIHSFDYSVDGEVSFAVDANTGAAREGVITLSYNDGDIEKMVRVSQKKYIDRSIVYGVESLSFAGYQDDTDWDFDSEWSSSTTTSSTAYYKLFKNNYLASPATNLEKVSSLKITVNMRTVGGVSGNSAKLDIKYGAATLGTLTATDNNLADYTITLNDLPVGDNYFTFESQSTDGTHGVGVRNITFEKLGEKVSISSVGYATFYDADHKVLLPEGVSAYTACNYAGAYQFSEAYTAGQVIPAGEPVVLAGSGNVTLQYTDAEAEDSYKEAGMNDLVGVATNITAEQMATAYSNDTYYHYALSLNENHENVGFYWIAEGGAAFAITAGKAYLVLPKSMFAAPVRSFIFGENPVATGVENVATVKATKALVNGQLVIVRNGAKFNVNGMNVK